MRLENFYKYLKAEWLGSLVKVRQIGLPHAKEYLNRLAEEKLIERVTWGWYWVPTPLGNPLDFLSKDMNFKIIAGQTAASLWNGDFVHREVYVVMVKDASYGRALKAFGQSRGWGFQVERYRRLPIYTKMDGLLVESPEESVIDCLRRWAFMDAFAILYSHPEIDIGRIVKKSYWQRLPGTGLRLKPVLEYGYAKLTGGRKKTLGDSFVEQEVDEAVEKVLEIG